MCVWQEKRSPPYPSCPLQYQPVPLCPQTSRTIAMVEITGMRGDDGAFGALGVVQVCGAGSAHDVWAFVGEELWLREQLTAPKVEQCLYGAAGCKRPCRAAVLRFVVPHAMCTPQTAAAAAAAAAARSAASSPAWTPSPTPPPPLPTNAAPTADVEQQPGWNRGVKASQVLEANGSSKKIHQVRPCAGVCAVNGSPIT